MRKVKAYLSVEVTHPRAVILVSLVLFMIVGMAVGAAVSREVHGYRSNVSVGSK